MIKEKGDLTKKDKNWQRFVATSGISVEQEEDEEENKLKLTNPNKQHQFSSFGEDKEPTNNRFFFG